MGSRTDRAAALRRYASQVGGECDRLRAGLDRLRVELHTADLDAEDCVAFLHEFESAAAVLGGVLDGAFEVQRERLFALADALDAMEYAAGAAMSSSEGPSQPSSVPGGHRLEHQGGVHGDPRWKSSSPLLREALGRSAGVPYDHVWSKDRFDGVGAPAELRSYHRVQEGPNACAVVAQIAVLESITGQRVNEADAARRAESMGIYAPAEGTPTKALGQLLASYGVEIERRENCGIEAIADALARGDRVMVALNAREIWEPRRMPNTAVAPQIPPAGHAVWVTGLDQQDGRWTVLLNDSGRPDGAMFAVSLEDFSQAWGEFDNMAVFARGRRA